MTESLDEKVILTLSAKCTTHTRVEIVIIAEMVQSAFCEGIASLLVPEIFVANGESLEKATI